MKIYCRGRRDIVGDEEIKNSRVRVCDSKKKVKQANVVLTLGLKILKKYCLLGY